jgi:TonB-linked SusC/RagA family outer membrane protein
MNLIACRKKALLRSPGHEWRPTPKTLLVMKCTAILMLATCLQISAAGIAQSITLSENNAPLAKVLKEIRRQSGYAVVYQDQLLQSSNPVTISIKKATLEQTLTLVFRDQPLNYDIVDNRIIVVKARQPQYKIDVPLQAAPADTIKGTVSNENGEFLKGVTVTLKGSAGYSRLTDEKGMYIMLVTDNNASLVFSHIGYATVTRPLSNMKVLNIVLRKKPSALDDVVVIGYGTVKRSDLTGSVAGIKSSDIAQSKVNSLQEAMEGRLAGVQVSSVNGQPGSAMNISIRGTNSVYGGSSPLFVIDGIPYNANNKEVATETIGNITSSNPLATINPMDIESIDVLKDASATAIYGSQGANGVILITTKAGKAGKARVDYQGYLSFESPAKKIPVLSPSEYIDYRKVVSPNTSFFFTDNNKDGIYGDTVSGVIDQPTDPSSYKQHDWQNEILRTGVSNNHSISISGGNLQGTTYAGGISYLNQNAIVLNNTYSRYTMHLRLDHQQGKNLKMGFNISSGYSEANGATQSGGGTGTLNGVVQNIVTSRPVEFYDPAWDVAGAYISPITMINNAYKNVSLLRNNLSAYLSYQLLQGLSFKVSGGGFLSGSKGKEFYGTYTDWGYTSNGLGTLQQNNAYSFFNTDQLIYEKKFNKKHSFNVMVAFENTLYNYETFLLQASNFLDQTTGINDISKASVLKSKTSSRDANKRISYFGRINYTFLNKHLFTASLRADGSDKFGPGNRFGYFPSFAYAWRLINERFLHKAVGTLSDLKLRLSYGITGNDRIPSWQYLATLGNAFYNGALGLAPNSFANPSLKWESTTQYNAGMDIAFFNNAISLTLDYYIKHTQNMLIPANVPSYSGYFTQWQNLGRVDNTGLDLQLSTRNIKTARFQWQTDFNFSTNKNIVVNIGNVGFIPVNIGGGWQNSQGRVIAGQPIGTAYGYVFDGVYQVNDFTWQNSNDPSIPAAGRTYTLKPGVVSISGVNVQPGSFKFKDLNKDNVVDLNNDRQVISHSQPKFFGGINNTFTYKDFDLSMLLDFSYGNQVYNESKFQLEGGALNTWFNISKRFWDNHWTPDNPTNKYGTFGDQNKAETLISSYFVEDASWLRLRNISFGYVVPQRLIKRMGISSLRIFFTGTNLYTWTRYSGFDPEVSSNEPLLKGYDRISYPRSKSIVFGANLSF